MALERTAHTAQGLHLVDEPAAQNPPSTAPAVQISPADIISRQLQDTLDSRVLIEQAKGILAHTDNIEMDEALRRLTGRARSTRRTLAAIAREVIDASGQR